MRKRLFIILLVSLIFVSGCWDKEEIDERIFVTDIGVDINEEYNGDGIDKLAVTYQYPNINALGKNASEDESTFLLSGPSSSIFQAGREFRNKVQFPLYYKHVKILIIGDEVTHDGKLVKQILDELNRDTKINKKAKILVAQGKAQDILNVNFTKDQQTNGIIYSMLRNDEGSGSYTAKSLIDIISDFDVSNISITPRIKLEDDGFKISGACIMKDYEHLAWIDGEQNRAINLINNEISRETIDVVYDENLIVYAVRGSDSNKEVNIQDGIEVDIDIELEGYLQGYTVSTGKTTYDNEILLNMEKTLNKKIENEVEKTIQDLQDIGADVIGVGEHLSKFNPKEWENIKDDWDEVFSEVEFDITVNSKIRRTGLVK